MSTQPAPHVSKEKEHIEDSNDGKKPLDVSTVSDSVSKPAPTITVSPPTFEKPKRAKFLKEGDRYLTEDETKQVVKELADLNFKGLTPKTVFGRTNCLQNAREIFDRKNPKGKEPVPPAERKKLKGKRTLTTETVPPPATGGNPPPSGGNNTPNPPVTGGGPRAPKGPSNQNNIPQFKDLREWIETLKFKMCPTDTFLKTFCEEQNVPFEFDQGIRAINAHGCSAAMRWFAVINFLKNTVGSMQNARVLSWFGADRDRISPPKGSGVSLIWDLSPNTPIAGDAARAFGFRTPLDTSIIYDGIVVVDIYQSGSNPYEAFTQAQMLRLCKQSRNEQVFVVAHRFLGCAGADVFTINDNKQTRAEGVWYKSGDPLLVQFSPEKGGTTYAGHPDVDWWYKRTTGVLDCSVVNQFNPFQLICIAPTEKYAQPLAEQEFIEPTVSQKELHVSFYYKLHVLQNTLTNSIIYTAKRHLPSFIGNLLPETEPELRMVHNRAYSATAAQYVTKGFSGITLDTVKSTVQREMSGDREMVALNDRFPKIHLKIVVQTAEYILFGEKTAAVERLAYLQQETFAINETLVNARQNKPPDTGMSKTKLLFCTFLGGVLLFRLYRMYKDKRARTPASVFPVFRDEFTKVQNRAGAEAKALLQVLKPRNGTDIYNMYIAPLTEEILKVTCPVISIVLHAFEVLGYAQAIGWTAASSVGLLHLSCYFLHYFGYHGTALALHFVNNVVATQKQRNLVPSGSLLNLISSIFTALKRWFPSIFGPPDEVSKPGFLSTHAALFADAYVSQIPLPVDVSSAVSYLSKDFSLPAVNASLPPKDKSFIGKMRVAIFGNKNSHVEDWQEIFEEVLPEHNHAIYPIIITNGLLYTPANSQINVLAALMYRIHRNPHSDCPPDKVRHRIWQVLSDYLIKDSDLFPQDLLVGRELPTIQEAVKIMGSKGARILRAHEKDVAEGVTKLKKSYNVKWDETIPLKWVETVKGPMFTIKPRAICNLDPVFHSRTTCHARLLADALHSLWDGWSSIQVGVFKLVPVFASGFTSAQLSNMMSSWWSHTDHNPTIYVAVAGDDSVAYITSNSYSVWLEADQSQFDQSQDDGPLIIAGRKWMSHLGIPQDVIDMWLTACVEPYRVDKRNLSIKGSTPVELPTGLTLTTVWNSVNCMLMYVFWCLDLSVSYYDPKLYYSTPFHRFDKETEHFKFPRLEAYADSDLMAETIQNYNFTEAAKYLGFNVKLQMKAEFYPISISKFFHPTFLKGWWFYDSMIELSVWLPLPSMVIKLGKVLKPPSTLYPKSSDPLGNVAYNIAMSFQHVPDWYPVLGTFLAKLKVLATKTDVIKSDDVIEGFQYKTKVTNEFSGEAFPNKFITKVNPWRFVDRQDFAQRHKLNRDNVLSAMCVRYDTTVHEIEDCEATIRCVHFLPAYVQHNLFRKLQSTDYC
jgi:hypothetical protein